MGRGMQALMEQTGAAEAGIDRQLERELVVRFAAGDESAFDAIVAAHQAPVTRVARRLLGWREDVGDVVQEVFIAAALAISAGAVEVRLSRARARLRQRLGAFIAEG